MSSFLLPLTLTVTLIEFLNFLHSLLSSALFAISALSAISALPAVFCTLCSSSLGPFGLPFSPFTVVVNRPLQIMVVVTCNIISRSLSQITKALNILLLWAWLRASLKRSKENVNVSNFDAEILETKEYANYVLQIKDNAEPLEKSTGCKGVVEFDSDQVPPLHSEETKNSWSLVVVTLTTIVVALPNKAGDHD
ncbi:hypothetical protein Tco_1336908 [Tanacetum coccineum]